MYMDLKQKQDFVFCLVVECPLGSPLSTCPAKELRKLPLHERDCSIKSKAEQQLDEIIANHGKCEIDRLVSH